MLSPTPNATETHRNGSTTITDTTIPISITEVVSRSFDNLSTFLSRTRPWPEFLSLSSLSFPQSLSTASSRFRINSNYFSINYSIVLFISIATSLLPSLFSLSIVLLLFSLWLLFFFFRQDPVFLLGRHVTDQSVLWALILTSVVAVLYTGTMNALLVGISVGVLLCVLHGVLKDTEGVFLGENDAVLNGLIVPKAGPSSSFV